MSIELTYLALSAAIVGIAQFVYIPHRMLSWGLKDTMGYPDNPPVAPQWVQRAMKAHSNQVENLVVFAALVLVAGLSGISTEMTVFASMLYFWTRLIYHVCYVMGIPILRTLAHTASWVASVIIFIELI